MNGCVFGISIAAECFSKVSKILIQSMMCRGKKINRSNARISVW